MTVGYTLETIGGAQEKGLDVKKVFEYFSSKSFNEILSEALENNELRAPGLKGSEAKCKSSVFKNNVNFLFFKGCVDFIVCQRLLMCDSIFIPGLGLCIPNPQSSNFKSYINEIDELASADEGGFNGVINGYHRPYHFFYDKMYPLLEGVDSVSGNVPYVNTVGSFLDLSLTNSKFFLGSKKIGDPGFFLVPAKSEYIRTPASFFKKLSTILCEIDDTEELESYDLVVWIGMSREKRSWIERTPALIILIELVKSYFSNPLFVIDGLTSDFITDPDQLREGKSSKETAEWQRIKKLFDEVKCLDLIGERAHKKILVANKVDFYISSHLTDSIWCAALGFKPGLTYQANASIGRGSFIHPLTNRFPASAISDLSYSSTVDYDGVDISIDPVRFAVSAFYSAVYTKSINDLMTRMSSKENSTENVLLASETSPLDLPFNSKSLLFKGWLNVNKKSDFKIFCKFYCSGECIAVEDVNVFYDSEIFVPSVSDKIVFECAGSPGDFSISKTSIMLDLRD